MFSSHEGFHTSAIYHHKETIKSNIVFKAIQPDSFAPHRISYKSVNKKVNERVGGNKGLGNLNECMRNRKARLLDIIQLLTSMR